MHNTRRHSLDHNYVKWNLILFPSFRTGSGHWLGNFGHKYAAKMKANLKYFEMQNSTGKWKYLLHNWAAEQQHKQWQKREKRRRKKIPHKYMLFIRLRPGRTYIKLVRWLSSRNWAGNFIFERVYCSHIVLNTHFSLCTSSVVRASMCLSARIVYMQRNDVRYFTRWNENTVRFEHDAGEYRVCVGTKRVWKL